MDWKGSCIDVEKKKIHPALRIAARLLSAAILICVVVLSASVQGAPTESPPPSDTYIPVMAVPPITAPPDPTPVPTPEFFEITMIGDCTLGANHYSKGSSVGYERVIGENYTYPFEKTLDYFIDDDFTIANLECALTDYNIPINKAFCFRAPPEYVQILKEGSVEFVSLGNNHSIDYGDTGYNDTKRILEDNGIGYSGRDEWSIYETASGLKIGVYAASFGDVVSIRAGITALKEAGAEFIIAALQWGTEGYYDVNDNIQRIPGRAAIDAGADVVMGTHPHTLQEIEEYNGHYIFYSIGNFTFGGNTNPRDKDSVIVKLYVMRDIDGTVSLSSYDLIPISSSGTEHGNNYQPVLLDPDSEAYARVLSKLDGTFDGPNLTVEYSYANE